MEKTYEIVTHSTLHNLEGIHCLICDFTSWNPNDILYQYCGNCHAFHDDLARKLANHELNKKGSQ